MNRKANHTDPPVVRCAIYTRTACTEAPDGEFDPLQAQRRSAEAWIAERQRAGWRRLPDRYDDGGFSGSRLDRPALKRLLSDVEARQIDCVVVDNLCRISRSLRDFIELNAFFGRHNVALVSVQQPSEHAYRNGRET